MSPMTDEMFLHELEATAVDPAFHWYLTRGETIRATHESQPDDELCPVTAVVFRMTGTLHMLNGYRPGWQANRFGRIAVHRNCQRGR